MAAEILDGEYEARVDVGRLVQHPRNPRRGNVGKIERLMEKNGFYGAVIAQRSTGFVLKGNHSLQAAQAQGLTAVPAIWLDVDDDEALRILLGDNSATDDAGYDDPVMASLLQELAQTDAGLEGTGYTAGYLEDLLERIGVETGPLELTDQDDAPPRPGPGKVITVPGDVWALGRHRLICGDSRDPAVVERALQGRYADMVWTDPPYAVAYVGKTADSLTIEGDGLDQDELELLLRGALGNARTWTRPGGSFWVAGPSGPNGGVFGAVLLDLGVWRQTIVWVKDVFVLGRQDYQGQFEALYQGEVPEPELGPAPSEADLVFIGWKPGAAHQPTPDRRQSNVWEIPRPRASKVHPTMKPVQLVERAVRNHTTPGGLVLDVFAGSGTTLIACHRAGRQAALVEKDPAYADVICRRWEEHTGEAPYRAADGERVSFCG